MKLKRKLLIRFSAEIFDLRLKRANLVNKADFDENIKRLNKKKLIQVKQNIYLLNMNVNNYKHLTQVFLMVKVTLMKMEHKFT